MKEGVSGDLLRLATARFPALDYLDAIFGSMTFQ